MWWEASLQMRTYLRKKIATLPSERLWEVDLMEVRE
jgi:hypothetical protein